MNAVSIELYFERKCKRCESLKLDYLYRCTKHSIRSLCYWEISEAIKCCPKKETK